jgi:hypothetical protein
MLHLLKLCVGIASIAQLRAAQTVRVARNPPLRHQTRNFPRRATEVTAGGSLYWVIGGAIAVRQRVAAIVEDTWDDGTRCAGLVLDPTLVPVRGRVVRPFQGWRYLEPADAPPDLVGPGGLAGMAEAQADFEAMPDAMQRELRALGLL